MKRIFTICFFIGFINFCVQAQTISNLIVYVQNTADSAIDKTVVGFNPSAGNAFDTKYDSVKVAGAPTSPNLYTLKTGQLLSTNILNSVTSTAIVRMGLNPGATGSFVMSFKSFSTFDNTTYLYLEDYRTGTMHNIRSGSYSFNADSGENPNRFALHFSPPAVVNTTAGCENQGTINITQPGTANWTYTFYSPGNSTNLSGVLNVNNPITATVPSGNYILKLTDGNNYKAIKTIAVEAAPTLVAGFTMASAEVTVGTPVTFSSTALNVDTYNWSFGDGKTDNLLSDVTHTYSTPGVYVVRLTVGNGPGCTSSALQTLLVDAVTTGIAETSTSSGTNMWSHDKNVFVDFTKKSEVNAVVKIFDILGRELSNEKFASSSVYQKQLPTIDAGYVIVSVTDNDKTTTSKLFVSNGK